MLHTADARAEFAPSSFRRWLLAGATASAATGIVAGAVGLDSLHWHSGSGVGLIALGLSLIAAAIGVVRMRAWGILLGAATSMVTLLAALWRHDAGGVGLAFAALPGLMLLLPVLIAKRERARAEATSSFTRVAAEAVVGYDEPARVRVAADSGAASFDEEADDASASHVAAAPPAARAQA